MGLRVAISRLEFDDSMTQLWRVDADRSYMNFRDSGEAALHLWDYFYMSRYPTDGERRPWHRIERATKRILESEQRLAANYPAPVRLANAKRVRGAIREVTRLLPQLESTLEPWVGTTLGLLENLAELAIATSCEEAEERLLH